jgi:hypothetical protein
MQIFNPFDHQYWLQIGVAIICGAMIGVERELRGKPTGMRTCILIVLGTAIFVKLGAVMGNERGDATRVLGQVVTGIGFLGAGVIMSRGDVIIGVTTASVVWVLAAIGAADRSRGIRRRRHDGDRHGRLPDRVRLFGAVDSKTPLTGHVRLARVRYVCIVTPFDASATPGVDHADQPGSIAGI